MQQYSFLDYYKIRRKKMWGKKILLIVMILYSFFYVYSSELQIVSIECPEEVVISDDIEIRDLEIECIIKYKYLGKDIAIKNRYEKKDIKKIIITALVKYINVFGEICYIDKEGRILRGPHDNSIKESERDFGFSIFSGTSSYDNEYLVFENEEIYSFSLYILSESVFDRTDIDKAILKKTLSTIVIVLDGFKVRWEVRCPKYNSKGELELDDINRAKIIRIRYK
jgi:hypothetical protein